MTRSTITRIPRSCAGLDEGAEVLDGAVVRVDPVEVGDVVAAVAKRRGVERQQPDAVDPEPLQVVELLLEAAEVARAVVVPVEERARVDLVEDGRLEPERVLLEPVPGLARSLSRGARHLQHVGSCAGAVDGRRHRLAADPGRASSSGRSPAIAHAVSRSRPGTPAAGRARAGRSTTPSRGANGSRFTTTTISRPFA